MARVSVRTINQMVEANGIHFIETAGGRLLVCLNSLHALMLELHTCPPINERP